MDEKEQFIKKMKIRTRRFAVDTIAFCESLKHCKASSVITYQLVKSATSTGANYRAACNSRSKNEFYSKICIVVEESDESGYWFEVIKESNLSEDIVGMEKLLNEANELTRIMAKAKDSVSKKKSY
jgi:four helix bundle protein